MKKLGIVVPTYNEALNIEKLLHKLKDELKKSDVFVRVLVVDDSSPDGTGEIVDKLKVKLKSDQFIVDCLHRKEKNGLGKAYVAGMKNQIDYKVDYILQMDADFSHDPKYIPDLLKLIEQKDLVIGSRYIKNGGVVNWNIIRKLLSKMGNLYSRIILGISASDLTGGFNMYKREVLETIGIDSIVANGYGFQIELKYRAFKAGFSIKEVPIIFPDRVRGESKISKKIIVEALLLVAKLRFDKYLGLFIKISLVAIVLLGVGIRLYDLQNNPVALNQDEAINGYDAFSLLHSLKDHHGNFLPTNFEAFGDWVPPILVYSTVPFVAVFGLSEFSIRLVTAFYGIGLILLGFILARQLGLKTWSKVFLISGLAFSPVLIAQSRFAIPPSIVPFFVLLSVIFLVQVIKDLQNKKIRIWILLLTGLSLALQFMSYPTQKVFVVMMIGILALVILLTVKLDRRMLLKLFIIPITFLVFVIGNFYPFIAESAKYNFRFSTVSLTSRYQGVEFVLQFAKRYVEYLGPKFLILNVDTTVLHHIPGFGLISASTLIFFYIGLALLIFKIFRSIRKKEKINPILLFLLLITLASPIVASVTIGSYHTFRSMHYLALIPIIAAIGVKELLELVKAEGKKRILKIFVLLAILFSIV
ncbi:MAG: glycosyltransferase, partial [bacterium]